MSRITERRQFGRRAVTQHGWIVVEGRPRIACRIANLSVIGALLQLNAPKWLPFQFQLRFDGIEEIHYCEIRHAGESYIGVRFVASSRYRRSDHALEADDWIGDANQTKPRLAVTNRG